MAWTTPRTWVTGETVTAAQLNTHVRDNLAYLYDLPRACVMRTTAFTVSNNTPVNLQFSSETYDTDNMWTSGSNTRLTVNTPGLYEFTSVMAWAATLSAGERRQEIVPTGSTSLIMATQNMAAFTSGGIAHRMTISGTSVLQANDYVQNQFLQASGGSLDINPNAQFSALWQASI